MEWTPVIVALLGAGVLRYLESVARWYLRRRAAATPAGQRAALLSEADLTVAVVAHARDELAEDNRRLREQIVEERARHAEDRAVWAGEKAGMRAEIDTLEAKLRAVLHEVEEFKRRHREA
ncbi:hypothetical protein [Kribbella deserti]|uniref:DUF2746 domain-containing protein n=1 Tax=Kribbella deserti TaxID=1926257 RepID=A0ABV6QGP9_9ACTN